MDRRNEQVVAWGAVLAVVWLVLDALLARQAHLLVLAAVLPYLAVAAAVSVVVWARLRLARRAEEERRDQAVAARERPAGALFEPDAQELDPFTAARSSAQFERWLVPAIALVVAAGEAVWAWRLWRGFGEPQDAPTRQLLAASLLAAQAFVLFLLSRYLLGLSRSGGAEPVTDSRQRLLRGPGAVLGLACLASLVGAVVAVVQEASYPPADLWAARGLVILLAVLAVEQIANFVWELYRPRRRRDLARAYETRLGLLVTDPGSWMRNVGGALDYQFGFQVSDTGLYRFLERALLPLVLFQLVVLYLLSALVFLGPEEEGIVERFGRPRATGWHLTSGLHLKWPWPFETVRRFPVQRVQSFPLGYSGQIRSAPAGAATPGQTEATPSVILWTVPHYTREDQFLTASHDPIGSTGETAAAAVPVNLVSFAGVVEYRITDLRRYAYEAAEPRRMLEEIAYRSLTLETAARDLFDVMTRGRQELARSLRTRIQREADHRALGVEILFVGIEGVHPPVSVADAFQSVIGATEEKEASILTARAAAIKTGSLTQADAAQAGAEAAAYAVRRTAIAAAEADRYQVQLQTYRQSPAVFTSRLYLGTLADALRDARKYVVAVDPATEVLIFNYEETVQPDLLDFGPAARPLAGGGGR